MVVEVNGLKNDVTGLVVNDATVTFTLKDTAGTVIDGPTAMTYVPASNGVYRGTLADTVAIVVGTRYVVQIDVDAGAGLTAKWELDAVCQTRK